MQCNFASLATAWTAVVGYLHVPVFVRLRKGDPACHLIRREASQMRLGTRRQLIVPCVECTVDIIFMQA